MFWKTRFFWAPEEDLPERDGLGFGSITRGVDLFDDDPNIEYITDIEGVYELESVIN